MFRFIWLLLACILGWPTGGMAAVPAYQIRGQAVVVKTKTLNLEMQVFTQATVRILRFAAGATAAKASLTVNKKPDAARFAVVQNGDMLTVKTAQLNVQLNLKSGLVRFATLAGALLLREEPTDSLFTPTSDVGKPAYIVQQRFGLSKDEALYGLGQFQDGVMNWRNHQVKLRQVNQFIANPFLVSTAGYGILCANIWAVISIRNESKSPSFHFVKTSCNSSLVSPAPFLSRS